MVNMSTPADSSPPPLRIGNAERESAYAALSAHLDAGRLDIEEYGERYGRAGVARTRPELEALFTDLPAPHPVFEAAPQPSWATAPTQRPRRRPLVPAVFALLPIIAIVIAISTGFWFLIFAIPFGASMVARRFGYRHHGNRRGYC
jgi:hypothetical protein